VTDQKKPEPKWRRNLRTSANAGRMSELRTVPVNVQDLEDCEAALGRLDEVDGAAQRAADAFAAWSETPNCALDCESIEALGELVEVLKKDQAALPTKR
jgi:hypothetical protein